MTDNTQKWQSLVDQQIQQAQNDGKLSGLSAEGRPLKLDDNPYTPADQRMAHKVLKDNDFAPEWIMLRKAIEEQEAALLRQIEKAVRAYKGALASAIFEPSSAEERRLQARAAWDAARKRLAEPAAKLNREIASYNLKVPPGIDQRPLFDLTRTVDRLLKD